MAARFHLPPHFVSFSSHCYRLVHSNSSLSFFYQYPSHLNLNKKHSIVCNASTKTSRPSRRLMSDADLCNCLREFVASVGLPDGHVPSTKELLENGRKDLANIVRRRGYKLIKELLTNSMEIVRDGSDSHMNINCKLNGMSDQEESGQEEKVNDMMEKTPDVQMINDGSATDDGSAIVNSIMTKFESAIGVDDQSNITIESPASLQEKVQNFVKYGELLGVEDDFGNDLKLNDAEGESSTPRENGDGNEPMMHDEVSTRHLAFISNNSMGVYGTLMLQRSIAPPAVEDNFTRNVYLSSQAKPRVDFDKHVNTETSKMENEIEIGHLKQILHQKELELSQLKQDIEKDKQTLSDLQTKAENEISKAQKLISEKDAELHAAEESLSGLVEAKIQYSGEGEMVEVSGSFNWWHQRIEMDPQPSSAILDPIGPRKARLWSTSLWLYPGTYEIKFIVDGQWKLDPERESTFRGGIQNNLLRVDI